LENLFFKTVRKACPDKDDIFRKIEYVVQTFNGRKKRAKPNPSHISQQGQTSILQKYVPLRASYAAGKQVTVKSQRGGY